MAQNLSEGQICFRIKNLLGLINSKRQLISSFLKTLILKFYR